MTTEVALATASMLESFVMPYAIESNGDGGDGGDTAKVRIIQRHYQYAVEENA